MTAVQAYIEAVKVRLSLCPKIISVEIVDERISLQNRGYFRARLHLINEDFLEISEYFIADGEHCRPLKYRYQWMDNSQTRLIRRWDNVPHFPRLPFFPHHVHIGNENNVFPSKSLNIIELIELIEKEPAIDQEVK